MATPIDPTLRRLQRRLDKWELEHLRKLARELDERLAEAERETARAWGAAESWREDVFQLMDELRNEGATIGLTQSGDLVVVETPRPDAAGETS